MNRVSDNFKILKSLRIQSSDWNFFDLRIDIPPLSFGSDASNPHTQYSNAIATFRASGTIGIGACFTLGEGNQYVCAAAEYIVNSLDGFLLADLLDSRWGLSDVLSNPLQLRWLSPNAGLVQMAAGLIMNTILDLAAKKSGMPAWKFLAYMESEELVKLVSIRHLRDDKKIMSVLGSSTDFVSQLDERVRALEENGVPAYFTTWIGSDASTIVKEIIEVNSRSGIETFKMKIGSDQENEVIKIHQVIEQVSQNFTFAADANQRLSYPAAREWLHFLSNMGFLWLEEPFAPDNVLLFHDLSAERRSLDLSCQIATGENCPNLHTAQALMDAGINRFQADACRMVGVPDAVFSGVLSMYYGIDFTPHAGGAGLDELAPHLQFFHLARVDRQKDIATSLTETIGFASKFYASPSITQHGRILAPKEPGLLVGYEGTVAEKLIPYRDGVTWLKL